MQCTEGFVFCFVVHLMNILLFALHWMSVAQGYSFKGIMASHSSEKISGWRTVDKEKAIPFSYGF